MSWLTRNKNFYRMFFAITAVIALQDLVAFGVNLADSIMLGNYSEPALAAVTQCNQIQFLLMMLAIGCGEGVVILSSQYWGKQDPLSIRKVAACGMRIAFYLSAVLFVICFIWPYWVLRIFTSDPAIIEAGVDYLQIVSISYVIFAVRTILLTTLRSVETVRIGLYLAIATLVINVFMNYILIFGKLGFPEMGVRGAAVATVLARAIELAAVLIYVRFADKKIRMRIKDWFRLDKPLKQDYIHIATPVIVSDGLWGVAMAIQAAILGHLGQAVITASGISNTMFSVVTVVGFGMTSAAAVVVGKTIGQGRFGEVKQYAKTLQLIFIAAALCTGLAMYSTRELVLRIYSIAPESQEMTLVFITILSVTVVGSIYQNPVIGGIIRGAGNTRFAFVVDNAFMFLFTIPLSFLSAYVFEFSPVVTFIFLKADQWLKCIVAVIKVNRFNWINVLTRNTT